MKQTPFEKNIYRNFQPGVLTKKGFLGQDNRHIHDIIKEDNLVLLKYKVTKEQIADLLQFFIDKAKPFEDSTVDLGTFTVQLNWYRGMIPCPFEDPGLHYKIQATVYSRRLKMAIQFSQLNVHLIKEHDFFEGKGSRFRLEPEELIQFLNLRPTLL